MKKLSLNVEKLAVESFPTAAIESDAGTVRAYDAPTPPYNTCGCTEGGSYLAIMCPPPATRTTC